MRLLACFTVFALVGLLDAAPTFLGEDSKLVVTPKFFGDYVTSRYTAKHDIVNLVVSLNSINVDNNGFSSSKLNESDTDVTIFFVEADVQPDGSRVDQGLYVLKDGKATKLLENGRDAAASGGDSKKVFLGAKDGLYHYNLKTNSAEKYGTITDSIISIDTDKSGEVIYILTEDRDVYKVTENGEKKEKLEDVVKPLQIVVDFKNNLFFFSDDKVPHVRTADGVKKIKGLPDTTGTVTLFKPSFSHKKGAPVIIDNKVYVMYPKGTSKNANFEFQPEALPTALSPGATGVQYYAYDKKIYEFNVLTLILSTILDYVNKQAEIRTFASHKNGRKRKFP